MVRVRSTSIVFLNWSYLWMGRWIYLLYSLYSTADINDARNVDDINHTVLLFVSTYPFYMKLHVLSACEGASIHFVDKHSTMAFAYGDAGTECTSILMKKESERRVAPVVRKQIQRARWLLVVSV